MAAVAEDRACPACALPVFPDEDYCEACGQRLDAPVARRCPGCSSTAISEDGYCDDCGLRQPDGTDHSEVEVAQAAGVSDRGRRHTRNEDAMALAETAGGVAAVVCDGVSSSSRPEDASRLAADTGAAALAEARAAGADPESATRTAATRAAEAVAGLGTHGGDTRPDAEPPSCTYVSALTHGSSVTVGWIGDSRVYWLAGGGGRRLTDDDSWAGQMVSSGVLTAEEAERHPNAHVITAWLGADADRPDPHVRTFTPDGPGVVLVCSDGLWNYYPEPEALAAALKTAVPAAAGPLEAARTLTALANDAGGRDNITVVVIPFTPHPNHATPPSVRQTEENAE